MLLILAMVIFMIFYKEDTFEHTKLLPVSPWTLHPEVIYSVHVEEASKGDILSITTSFEVTNDLPYNVMISSAIVLTNSEVEVKGVALDRPSAWNVTPDMHHGVVNRCRQFKLPEDISNKYVNVIAGAASDAAKPNDVLTVEQQYGHLDLVIHDRHFS